VQPRARRGDVKRSSLRRRSLGVFMFFFGFFIKRASFMNIVLIHAGALNRHGLGNRTTSTRWARIFLRQLGHRVTAPPMKEAEVDLLIAMHAWRSEASIRTFGERTPIGR